MTLGRPDVRNVIDEQMAAELRDVFAQLGRDDAIWVIILVGSGSAFCDGAEADGVLDGQAMERLKVASAIADIPKPVIAAINGDAIDQGLELALACDVRIAVQEARFALTQVRRGCLPWDGGTQRLPKVVGRSWGTYMLLTSASVDAEHALQMGLVNEIVESSRVLPRAKEMALIIAQHGPIAARYAKEAVLKGSEVTLEQGLRLEADMYFLLHSTGDRAEGIRSFLDKRKPEYSGE